MEEYINFYDSKYCIDRARILHKCRELIEIYVENANESNEVVITKKDLLKVLESEKGLQINYRTLSDWIRSLAENGLIKYKYSGRTRLNPFFCFDGSSADYIRTVKEWNEFKSDIQALKLEYYEPRKKVFNDTG